MYEQLIWGAGHAAPGLEGAAQPRKAIALRGASESACLPVLLCIVRVAGNFCDRCATSTGAEVVHLLSTMCVWVDNHCDMELAARRAQLLIDNRNFRAESPRASET